MYRKDYEEEPSNEKSWDLTNKRGMLQALNQLYKGSPWPVMAYKLVKDFLNTDTSKQAKTLEDLIRAGKLHDVDEMDIKMKNFVGGKINTPDDIKIDMQLGKGEETIIIVKYK